VLVEDVLGGAGQVLLAGADGVELPQQRQRPVSHGLLDEGRLTQPRVLAQDGGEAVGFRVDAALAASLAQR
jgi:hypothetical protein